MTERACKWCGAGMEGKRQDAVCCSKKCRNASWYQANMEHIAEQQREYRNVNAERIAEYHREYYNTRLATASTLRLTHTISQLKGTTDGTHEPE